MLLSPLHDAHVWHTTRTAKVMARIPQHAEQADLATTELTRHVPTSML
jgi:hypothetical protein